MINKIVTIDAKDLRYEVSIGIDLFINKNKIRHGLTTDYALEKKAGLCDNTIANLRRSGNCKLDTLYKLGCAVGFDIEEEDSKGVIIRVLKEMGVK